MSSISVNTEIDIELSESEKEHLIQSYRILKNILGEMCRENLEDTLEALRLISTMSNLCMILRDFKIDFEE